MSDSIERSVHFMASDSPVAGRPFAFTIDLRPMDGVPVSDGFRSATREPLTSVDVDVFVFCDGTSAEDGFRRSKLTLHSDGSSVPATIEVTPAGETGQPADVSLKATFMHNGRHSGYAQHDFPAVPVQA